MNELKKQESDAESREQKATVESAPTHLRIAAVLIFLFALRTGDGFLVFMSLFAGALIFGRGQMMARAALIPEVSSLTPGPGESEATISQEVVDEFEAIPGIPAVPGRLTEKVLTPVVREAMMAAACIPVLAILSGVVLGVEWLPVGMGGGLVALHLWRWSSLKRIKALKDYTLISSDGELDPYLCGSTWAESSGPPRLLVHLCVHSVTGAWGAPIDSVLFLPGSDQGVPGKSGWMNEPARTQFGETGCFLWCIWSVEVPSPSDITGVGEVRLSLEQGRDQLLEIQIKLPSVPDCPGHLETREG